MVVVPSPDAVLIVVALACIAVAFDALPIVVAPSLAVVFTFVVPWTVIVPWERSDASPPFAKLPIDTVPVLDPVLICVFALLSLLMLVAPTAVIVFAVRPRVFEPLPIAVAPSEAVVLIFVAP